ncbi:MAG: hypothetical protein EYC62_02805 [Alphaproteobacteria bacterium]|nr:MAG: hypothetical protein EYC62_02805 [Alphaproteobacteria bacterium]
MDQINSIKSYAEQQALQFAERLSRRLSTIRQPDEFADWLIRYDYFNRGFPGAALELAGQVAFMDDDFGDIGAEEVSSGIIAAITDEFIDRQTMETSLHSSLRRELVARSLQVLSGNARANLESAQKPYYSYRRSVLESTRIGYGLVPDESCDQLRRIMAGIAFFMASETSGAQEFTVLNRCMSRNWPVLVKELAEAEDDTGRQLYRWVVEHQDLESDHARFALSAVRSAFKNYSAMGNKSDELVSYIYQGIDQFFKMADETLIKPAVIPSVLGDYFALNAKTAA